jgi:hypothetical protein
VNLRDLISSGGSVALDKLADLGSMIRYGVPFDQKAAMAIRGEVPGFDRQNAGSEMGADIEQRRAAAYLFGKQWPNLAPEWQPLVDRFIRSGDDPRLLAVTQDAVERGAYDALRARPTTPRPMPSRR